MNDPDWRRNRRQGLVLAYHALGEVDRARDTANLAVPPARFRAQLEDLHVRGFEFVTLSDFAAATGRGKPRGICAVTFDDATLDNLEVALPILEELDVPATVFACPELLGQPNPWILGPEFRFMTEAELREMSSHELIEIGSHTRWHMNMEAMTRHEAREEMAASKHLLEVKLGQPVRSFAFPGYAYSPACPEAAQLAGYDVAVTGQGRGGWDRYQLRRENIDALDGSLGFGLKTRHLWHPLRTSPAGPLARVLARRFRHPEDLEAASAPRPQRERAGATLQRER